MQRILKSCDHITYFTLQMFPKRHSLRSRQTKAEEKSLEDH
jgi:hypothetical protein